MTNDELIDKTILEPGKYRAQLRRRLGAAVSASPQPRCPKCQSVFIQLNYNAWMNDGIRNPHGATCRECEYALTYKSTVADFAQFFAAAPQPVSGDAPTKNRAHFSLSPVKTHVMLGVEETTMIATVIANEFSNQLRRSLTAEVLAEVVKLNNAETDKKGICHTHDFCDANMEMIAALETLGIIKISDALWNEAWSIAKGGGFNPSPSAGDAPKVEEIAWEFIAHVFPSMDRQQAQRFIEQGAAILRPYPPPASQTPTLKAMTKADQKTYDPIAELEYIAKEISGEDIEDLSGQLEFAIQALKEMKEFAATPASTAPHHPTCNYWTKPIGSPGCICIVVNRNEIQPASTARTDGWVSDISQKGETMNFGQAIEALKNGQKVSRSGWNGKNMWLGYVPADQWGLGSGQNYDYGKVGNSLLPWIGMKTADSAFVPWLASQTDVLAEDWGIVA